MSRTTATCATEMSAACQLVDRRTRHVDVRSHEAWRAPDVPQRGIQVLAPGCKRLERRAAVWRRVARAWRGSGWWFRTSSSSASRQAARWGRCWGLALAVCGDWRRGRRARRLGCRDLLLGAPPEPETRVAHGHRRGSSGASGASRHTHTSRHTHSVQTVERALVRRGRCRRTLGPRPPGRVQLQAAGVGTPLVWPDAVTLTVRHVTRMLWSASTSPQPLALHLSTVASTSPLPFSDELCVAVVQHWSVCNVLQCASSGVA